MIGELVETGHNACHEDFARAPQGMIKEMLKKFGVDFQQLVDIEGVYSVKYLVGIRKLEIIASEPGYNKVTCLLLF